MPTRIAPHDEEETSNAGERRPTSRVRAADRTLAILNLFATSERVDWTLDDLARGADLPKSTVHRLLETLYGQGFVEPGASRGSYRLGARVAAVGHAALRSRRPAPSVATMLTRVSAQVGESIGLSVLVGSDAMIVERGNTLRGTWPRAAIGATLPGPSSAAGRVLLSGLSDAAITRLFNGGGELPRETPRSVGSLDELLTEIRRTRERHYALDDEQVARGVRCAAVPVYDGAGHVTHALGVSLPAAKLAPDRAPGLVALLQRLATLLCKHASQLTPAGRPLMSSPFGTPPDPSTLACP